MRIHSGAAAGRSAWHGARREQREREVRTPMFGRAREEADRGVPRVLAGHRGGEHESRARLRRGRRASALLRCKYAPRLSRAFAPRTSQRQEEP